MSSQPPGPPTSGYAQLRIPRPVPPQVGRPQHSSGYVANTASAQPMRETTAPTLLQYWRSDSRVVPGRRPPTWAGLVAFWIGLLSAGLLFAGVIVDGALLVALASPFSTAAVVFALIALVAGIGRGFGFIGLMLALAGNRMVWAWLAAVLD